MNSGVEQPIDPCNPSPCGSNAVCRNQNGVGSCACIPEYFGDPYVGCKPECTINSECPSDKACRSQKCRDPCPGTCAWNAICRVVNHSPQCSCNPGYTGDPFTGCRPIPPPTPEPVRESPRDPCVPSPCGPYATCSNRNGQAVCFCLPTYIGNPPYCRPECLVRHRSNIL
jgi:hypothetical protein